MAFGETDLVLGIDLGTESMRAGLFNAQGDLVASASVASRTDTLIVRREVGKH